MFRVAILIVLCYDGQQGAAQDIISKSGSIEIELIHKEDLQSLSFSAFGHPFKLSLETVKDRVFTENAHVLRHDVFEVDHFLNESFAFKHCDYLHGREPLDTPIVATISYCEHRGFRGRIMLEHGVYDIAQIEGVRHLITSADLGADDDISRDLLVDHTSIEMTGDRRDTPCSLE